MSNSVRTLQSNYNEHITPLCHNFATEYSIAMMLIALKKSVQKPISTESRSIYTLPFITSHLMLANLYRLSFLSVKLHVMRSFTCKRVSMLKSPQFESNSIYVRCAFD